MAIKHNESSEVTVILYNIYNAIKWISQETIEIKRVVKKLAVNVDIN